MRNVIDKNLCILFKVDNLAAPHNWIPDRHEKLFIYEKFGIKIEFRVIPW